MVKNTTLRLEYLRISTFICIFVTINVKRMITIEEVQKFLNQFHEKMKIFGIIYRDDRGKNQKTLEELEIVPSYRRVVIENLVVEDYVQGPVSR